VGRPKCAQRLGNAQRSFGANRNGQTCTRTRVNDVYAVKPPIAFNPARAEQIHLMGMGKQLWKLLVGAPNRLVPGYSMTGQNPVNRPYFRWSNSLITQFIGNSNCPGLSDPLALQALAGSKDLLFQQSATLVGFVLGALD